MEELESIKRKVKKLLALSKSPNENEAALAMKMANDLIGRYKLNQSEFSGYTMKTVKGTRRYVEWRAVLSNAVEQLYATYHFRDRETGEYIFYGEELDVFMSTEMYSYLVKTVERMVKNNVRKNAKYKYRQSYRAGLANRLWDRIKELGELCSWRSPKELESLKKDISVWCHNTNELTTKTSTKTTKLNKLAFARGIFDADGINLNRQMTDSRVRRIKKALS